MSGYLEEYGAGEDRRENLIRNAILITVAVVIVGAVGFYLLRPVRQIHVSKNFLAHVKNRDYAGAYVAWGCSESHPCKDYPYTKFLEDWGSQSAAAANPVLRITDIESCGTGEIVSVDVNPGDSQKLFVEKGSDSLSFSPVPVCPGKNPWAIMLHRTLGKLRKVLF